MTEQSTQAASSPKKRPERPRGWWYPWIFVAFFAVVVSVNGVMIFFAYDSWTGLETKDHYVKGLAYDDTIAAKKAQEALGWTVSYDLETISKNPDGSRQVAYKVTFLDHNQAPVTPLKARTFFIRPTSEGMDVNALANKREDGVVGGVMTVAAAGQWDLRVYAESRGRKYQLVQRVVID